MHLVSTPGYFCKQAVWRKITAHQWFSNLCAHQDHARAGENTARASDLFNLCWAQQFVFLAILRWCLCCCLRNRCWKALLYLMPIPGSQFPVAGLQLSLAVGLPVLNSIDPVPIPFKSLENGLIIILFFKVAYIHYCAKETENGMICIA